MIYDEPRLTPEDEAVLQLIGQQRERLKIHTQHNPRRWFGSLRRSTFARAIQGSNSIEGYNATIDEAIAAVDRGSPSTAIVTPSPISCRHHKTPISSRASNS
jgi:hypothetical protein